MSKDTEQLRALIRLGADLNVRICGKCRKQFFWHARGVPWAVHAVRTRTPYDFQYCCSEECANKLLWRLPNGWITGPDFGPPSEPEP